VILPVDANATRILVAERLAELTAKCAALASSPQAPVSLKRVEAALRRLLVSPGITPTARAQTSAEVGRETTG